MTGSPGRDEGTSLWLRTGPATAPTLLIFEPLFEEANRCRRLIASLMRALADAGFASVIPNLPGTGESLIPIQNVRFQDWQTAADAAIAQVRPAAILSFRGGSLLDGGAVDVPVWRLSPETGQRIIRDLKRAGLASAATGDTLYAGHALGEAFVAELESCPLPTPARFRTVRLDSEAAAADHKLPGKPLWRRAEPDDDPELAMALADDITIWIRACGV